MRLLFVDSCISQRGDQSRTRALANAFLETFLKAHPGTQVERVALEQMNLRPFDERMLNERAALAKAGDFRAPVFDLARQFREADAVLVAAPFWDLSFPAMLRIYIEHISVVGLTYHYDAEGCHGDCRAATLTYLTSGGDAEQAESLGILHWKQLSSMFGIPRFDDVFASGLDLDPGKAEELVAAACQRASRLAEGL